jgi:hypothetical protein
MAISAASLPRLSLLAALPALVALSILKPGPAGANEYDDARDQHPALFQAYYDAGLIEYCGLLTPESVGGFHLRRDELLALEPLSAEQYRRVRVAASIAIDYQYANHGLSGQRVWCKTDGRDAYDRFVARYRTSAGANTPSGETP